MDFKDFSRSSVRQTNVIQFVFFLKLEKFLHSLERNSHVQLSFWIDFSVCVVFATLLESVH